MITSAGDNFSAFILDRALVYDQYAQNSASAYARSDDKKDQADYAKWSAFAQTMREFHSEACRAMHAIEAEMQAKKAA